MEQITIIDVAKACGVGVSTVSRAINNHPDINEETKQLVMATIDRLGYIPNNSARNLKRTEARSIAILVKGMANPFFSDMIKIMEEEIIRRKYTLVLQHVDPNEDEVDVALELVKEKRLSGIIFLGGLLASDKKSIKRLSVPYVVSTVGCHLDIGRRDYSSVAVDDEKESYKVTKYLISKGHRRICILAGGETDTSIALLRINGYKKALAEEGIEFDDELVRYLPKEREEYTTENGYKMTREIIGYNSSIDRKESEKVTAIFAIADVMAVGACRALLENGISIPKDMAVVGFDGIELTKFYYPSITTLAQPLDKIADASIRLLFGILDGNRSNEHIFFDGELIERETT